MTKTGTFYQQAVEAGTKIFATAPMIDWSDRAYRVFARQFTKNALLFTEMIVADAILRGNRDRLLGFDAVEQPVALQLGGNSPEKLAEAARIGEGFGYAEINLNVGCPSDRVQSGTFGACLMREPDLVADCVVAMKAAVKVPVTVKCRIGVDDQAPEEALFALAEKLVAAGVDALVVHARKAWLQGLSPKENRDIPPLDYAIVRRLKARWPALPIAINGGIASIETAAELLAPNADGPALDGVMLGRAAYHDPALLLQVDPALFGTPAPAASEHEALERLMPYLERLVAEGHSPHALTRHVLGLFQGQPGARAFRRHLSTEAVKPGATAEVLRAAAALVKPRQRQAA